MAQTIAIAHRRGGGINKRGGNKKNLRPKIPEKTRHQAKKLRKAKTNRTLVLLVLLVLFTNIN